jgi:hypothetical protein
MSILHEIYDHVKCKYPHQIEEKDIPKFNKSLSPTPQPHNSIIVEATQMFDSTDTGNNSKTI